MTARSTPAPARHRLPAAAMTGSIAPIATIATGNPTAAMIGPATSEPIRTAATRVESTRPKTRPMT